MTLIITSLSELDKSRHLAAFFFFFIIVYVLCFAGASAWYFDGSVLAVYPEHFWGDPLPADDLDGRDRRRLGLLHNCLHVLLYGV